MEGVDGSGISTQTRLLQHWLETEEEKYGRTLFTKEPTDGPVGGLIRLALTKRLKPLDERVMALLFAADRIDHLYQSAGDEQQGGIVAHLEQGINVVSDRFYLSSLAYQSLQVDRAWLEVINRYCIKPDLTILLQVPIEHSVRRRNKSRFHEELYEKEESLVRINQNYLEIASALQAAGERIRIIDGTQDKEKVFQEIKQAVRELFTTPLN